MPWLKPPQRTRNAGWDGRKWKYHEGDEVVIKMELNAALVHGGGSVKVLGGERGVLRLRRRRQSDVVRWLGARRFRMPHLGSAGKERRPGDTSCDCASTPLYPLMGHDVWSADRQPSALHKQFRWLAERMRCGERWQSFASR